MLYPSTMLTRLDAETRLHHVEADSSWLDLMTASVTREQYLLQLIKIYGFEAPLEAALAYTPHVVEVVRRGCPRSGLIAQDLLALGLRPATIAQLPQSWNIGPFRDLAEGLAWKYVADRATLLHAAVRRHLVARLPEVANASTYLAAADGLAASSWHQLGVRLDHAARSSEVADGIVASAHDAFRCLCAWFRGEEPLRMTS